MVKQLLRKLILWALGDETAEDIKRDRAAAEILNEWLEGEK